MRTHQNVVCSLLVVGLLAGCSLVKTAPSDDRQVQLAIVAGTQAGNTACIVALTEKPAIKPQLVELVFAGKAILASDDPTISALNTVVAKIKDPKTRMYAALGVSTVLTSLAGSGVDVTTIEAGSPLSAGLSALFDACDTVIKTSA